MLFKHMLHVEPFISIRWVYACVMCGCVSAREEVCRYLG